MARYVEVEGTAALRDLARRLKEAGETGVQRALVKGIRQTTKDAVDDVKKTVRKLPIDGQGSGGRGGGARSRIARQVGNRQRTERLLANARKRSGLRETIARATASQIQVSASSARVRVRVRRAGMPADQRTLPHRLNKGRWRHPVFGNREVWAEQTSKPGWFDETLREHGEAVRDEIARQIKQVLDDL